MHQRDCQSLLLSCCVFAAFAANIRGQQDVRITPAYVMKQGQYQWFLNELERDRGIGHYGSAERLRLKMKDMQDGKQIKITTIGGSITGGQGAADAPNWSQVVFDYFDAHYAGKVVGHIGAVGGTMTSYMVVCYSIHVPKDSDIIFVEYSVNDHSAPMPAFRNEERRSFERLLRKLLSYPKRPAVVLMHSFRWTMSSVDRDGTFWNNAEREFHEFALYYSLPELSIKAAAYHNMVQGVDGFRVDRLRNQDMPGTAGHVFYHDVIHPDGRTGTRATAELAIHLLLRAHADIAARPIRPDEAVAAAAPLPRPMIEDNYESLAAKCLIGLALLEAVVSKDGFEWINESKTDRPKWGMVATTVGSKLRLKLDTRTDGGKSTSNEEVLVELAYLQSYEHMGTAKVTCESGCKCRESLINGHTSLRESQLHLHGIYASQHEACIVAVEVLAQTQSPDSGHKVKVAAATISDKAGRSQGIGNSMAVEYAHDISMRSKDGTFELRNHAR